jgi:BlaI family penicillinase repressor
MEKLTRQEEKVMQAVWITGEGAIKDIMENYPDKKKPHYNTLATVVKLLESKGYIDHKTFGNVNVYFPLYQQEEYTAQFLSGFVTSYFGSSYKNVVSFFAQNEKLSENDLKEILEMVQKNKEKP